MSPAVLTIFEGHPGGKNAVTGSSGGELVGGDEDSESEREEGGPGPP